MKTTKTPYTGIDYGLGQSNIDNNTGLRYGVMSVHNVASWIYDELNPQYPEQVECICPKCEHNFMHSFTDEVTCPNCKHEYYDCMDNIQAIAYVIDSDSLQLQLCEDNTIFVFKSEYYTYASFCSPCVPGACDLDAPLFQKVSNNKCYCLGHEWFEEGKAPYPVYSVKTGKLVDAKNSKSS